MTVLPHPNDWSEWFSSPSSSIAEWDAIPETIWCLFLSLAFSSLLSAKRTASSLCVSLMFLPCMNDISHWEKICFWVRALRMFTGSLDDNHVPQVNSFSVYRAGKEQRAKQIVALMAPTCKHSSFSSREGIYNSFYLASEIGP